MFLNYFSTLSAVLHFGFFVLESILFTKPIGLKIFKSNQDWAKANELFAFNQGFYNLFLCMGLFVAMILPKELGLALQLFCLSSMLMAGIVLVCSDRKLWRGFIIQSGPPLLALISFYFNF